MRRIALIAALVLTAPTAALVTPAEAAVGVANAEITRCSKTRYGVTVRIKIRNNDGKFFLVRVSHPRGKGSFREPRITSVRSAWGQIGHGVSLEPRGAASGRATSVDSSSHTGPSFRVSGGGGLSVSAKFRLANGKRVALECRNY